MADEGIVRNRAKIEATIDNAKAYLQLRERTRLKTFLAGFLGNEGPVQNRARAMGDIPAETELSKRISKALEGGRLPLRRPDDGLRLHAVVGHGQRSSRRLLPVRRVRQAAASEREVVTRERRQQGTGARLAAHAVGAPARSAEPLAGRHRDRGHRSWTGPCRPLEWADGRRARLLGRSACTARRGHRGRAQSTTGRLQLAARSAAARCARVRCRRPHQPVQDRHRPRLQSLRVASTRRNPRPLRRCPPICRATFRREIKAADRIAAYFEATRLAGFSTEEATIYFGQPKGLAADDRAGWPGPNPGRLAARPSAMFLHRFRDLIERL